MPIVTYARDGVQTARRSPPFGILAMPVSDTPRARRPRPYQRRLRHSASGIPLPRSVDLRTTFGRRLRQVIDAMAGELGGTLSELDQVNIRAIALAIVASEVQAETDPLSDVTLDRLAAAREAMDGLRKRGEDARIGV